jgi:hypothetical protein
MVVFGAPFFCVFQGLIYLLISVLCLVVGEWECVFVFDLMVLVLAERNDVGTSYLIDWLCYVLTWYLHCFSPWCCLMLWCGIFIALPVQWLLLDVVRSVVSLLVYRVMNVWKIGPLKDRYWLNWQRSVKQQESGSSQLTSHVVSSRFAGTSNEIETVVLQWAITEGRNTEHKGDRFYFMLLQ